MSKISKTKVVPYNLEDSSLPAWNYFVSGQIGSGMSLPRKSPEEEYQEKLAEENEMFNHFVATGEVKKPIS